MANFSSGIVCYEEAGTASESYDDSRGILKASVTLRCAWADRHALVADICGQRLQWPKGAAGLVPKAATAGIVPVVTPDAVLAVDGQEMVYGQALVTINYTTEIVDVVSESIEPYAEFITLDHRWFRWDPAGLIALRDEEAPGRLVRGINFVRTELDKTGTLNPLLLSLIGSVNISPVTGSILAFTFPDETLLYAPPTISYKKDSTNTTKYDLTKKFTYNQNGWNRYFRPSTGLFSPIYLASSGSPYKSYPVEDLGPLFT